jgi:hypothetical protein
MSSVGFSVVRTTDSANFKSDRPKSILAWIWLTLVPPKPELTEPILIDKKARRRSAPAALQSRKRHSTSPSVASGEAQTSPVSPQRTRRVYFIDSPTSSAASRPTNFQRTSNDSSDLTLLSSPTSEISPSSSSSTLEHTYTAIPAPTLETCRESAIESDSSNSSPRPSLSLSRPFQKARPRRSSTTSATSVPDIAPIVTGPRMCAHLNPIHLPDPFFSRRYEAAKVERRPHSFVVFPAYFRFKEYREPEYRCVVHCRPCYVVGGLHASSSVVF